MPRKSKPPFVPQCVFCQRTGSGVQFAIFNPRFKPFGTACDECEKTLPPGTEAPKPDFGSSGESLSPQLSSLN